MWCFGSVEKAREGKDGKRGKDRERRETKGNVGKPEWWVEEARRWKLSVDLVAVAGGEKFWGDEGSRILANL